MNENKRGVIKILKDNWYLILIAFILSLFFSIKEYLNFEGYVSFYHILSSTFIVEFIIFLFIGYILKLCKIKFWGENL
jgi:hypothetical protein